MNQHKEFDLLTMGEVLLRLSPPVNERLTQGDILYRRAGGAEFNVAAGVSLLGLRTGIISKIPSNDMGTFIKNNIRLLGVSDDYLSFDSSKDARLGLYYYENGAYPRKPRVIYDRHHTSMQEISIEDYDDGLFASTRCFHTSGITLALCENTKKTALEMIKRFKAQGTIISFDVNFRGNLWTGEEARKCMEALLPYVDIFFCSEETARLTFQKEGDVYGILKSFTKDYPISVVAATQRIVHSPKCHSFGSLLYCTAKDRYYEEKPYEKIDVVDRIGSGDAYVSGVLYGLLTNPDDYLRAVSFGNAASAVKNTILGDLPSSDLKEITSIIKEHHSAGKHAEMER